MKVYRGLNLHQEELTQIQNTGDNKLEKGSWLMKPLIDHHDKPVKEVINELLGLGEEYLPRYNRESENPFEFGKYVTGQFLGAAIYSNDSTSKDLNIVLEVDADVKDLIIDGRDSLYGLSMKILKNRFSNKDLFNSLESTHGKKYIEYFSYISELSSLQKEKIFNERDRLTDYICMDLNVIQSHLANTEVLIQGRYNTKFLSAFGLLGGISPKKISKTHNSPAINRKTPIDVISRNYNIKSTFNVYDL